MPRSRWAVVPASTRTMAINNRPMVSLREASGARIFLIGFKAFHRKKDSPSPPYSGERVGVRGRSRVALLTEWPLTLTLSPEYGGEGTRKTQDMGGPPMPL